MNMIKNKDKNYTCVHKLVENKFKKKIMEKYKRIRKIKMSFQIKMVIMKIMMKMMKMKRLKYLRWAKIIYLVKIMSFKIKRINTLNYYIILMSCFNLAEKIIRVQIVRDKMIYNVKLIIVNYAVI